MKELVLNDCRLDKRYDIHDQLGRGSYSEVFLALDRLASPSSPHSQVVIKALNVFLQDDLDPELERTLVENFQNEAMALDRVRHPNIISRLGHGTARDLNGVVFHYLVLEYLSGGTLQARVREGALPLELLLFYLEQICAGLGHAHKRGIIHRDIKPQNLLLTADKQTVKIADFGVARISLTDSPITRVGTNVYAPPEHSPFAAGQTGSLEFGKLTPAADIYSLAKTVYTLASAESPRVFTNEPITSLPGSIAHKPWSEALLTILNKATQSDPRQRYASVEELWADCGALKAADDEPQTVFRSSGNISPQAHVSRGYTPSAPERPSFDKLDETPSLLSVRAAAGTGPVAIQSSVALSDVGDHMPSQPGARRARRSWKRIAAVIIIFAGFAGVLAGTASYMRGRGFLPSISNPFKSQTATASTDIYLRSAPNTDNDPIGLVTRNSKLRIVNSRDNWYQVDVVSQGRANSQSTTTRGWLNGKYVELDDN